MKKLAEKLWREFGAKATATEMIVGAGVRAVTEVVERDAHGGAQRGQRRHVARRHARQHAAQAQRRQPRQLALARARARARQQRQVPRRRRRQPAGTPFVTRRPTLVNLTFDLQF